MHDQITAMIPHNLLVRLNKYAEYHEVSLSEAIREALDAGLNEMQFPPNMVKAVELLKQYRDEETEISTRREAIDDIIALLE